MKSYVLFFLGVFFIAGVIGLLTGLSASPVVSVLIPLLFGLITAGGAIYVARASNTASAGTAVEDSRARALVLGLQLIAFSWGFLLGLWPGTAAKFHPEKVWRLDEKIKPAYAEFRSEDLRILLAVIELDQRMKESGLDYNGRRATIRNLYEAIGKRTLAGGGVIADSDLEAVRAILGVTKPSAGTAPLYVPIARNYEEERRSPLGISVERMPG